MDKCKNILVVDDSPTMRRIIKKELESGGYNIIEAGNGLEALVAISSEMPDLITLDIDMPNMDGFETCRKIQTFENKNAFSRNKASVPVIFITANDTIEYRTQGFNIGAVDFITKPFPKGSVLEAVNKILCFDLDMGDYTALVVDDSDTSLRIVTNILKQEGVSYIKASDGDEAYEVISRKMNSIDIIITDLFMGRMNGDELCRRVRSELKLVDVPIIFLTAMSEQSQLLDLFKVGGTDYIVKPFVKEELLARIKVHMERTGLNKKLRNNLRQQTSFSEAQEKIISFQSKDLRKPLNEIKSVAGRIMAETNVSAELVEKMKAAEASSLLLLDLVRSVESMFRVKTMDYAIEKKEVEVAELVHESVMIMNYFASEKGINIEINDDSAQKSVNIDKNSLLRVLNSTLSHSIRNNNNKVLKIAIYIVEGKKINILISDIGYILKTQETEKLFANIEKDFQQENVLNNSSKTELDYKIILEEHGGNMYLINNNISNTEVCIELPVYEPDAKSMVENEKMVNSKTELKSLKILLAGNMEGDNKALCDFLNELGQSVTIVKDGMEAFLTAQKNEFNLVFLSIDMEKMNGPEAAIAIRASAGEDLPIIGLGLNKSIVSKEKCLKSGINDFLSMPLRRDAIVELLENLSGPN